MSIKNTIDTISEIITNSNYVNTEKELKALSVKTNPAITNAENLANNLVLEYFAFLKSSLGNLKKAVNYSQYLAALGNFEEEIRGACEDITYIVNKAKDPTSSFYTITSSDILEVVKLCNPLYNYYKSIYDEATKLQSADNISLASPTTSKENISADNLSQYKEDLINLYIDPDLNLAINYSLNDTISNSQKTYPKVSTFLYYRAAVKEGFLGLLKYDFTFSNLPQIISTIESSNLRSNSINLRNVYGDLITNFASYNFQNESVKFTKNEASLQSVVSILYNLSDLGTQTLKESKASITPSFTSQNTTDKNVTDDIVKKDNESKVKAKPESWGVKFTVNKPYYGQLTSDQQVGPELPTGNYYMNLLPAQSSTIPMQGGRDVPNAMPGLNFKIVPNIGKHKIPGFQPVFQNLGMGQMIVTLVGSFTGADGAVNQTDTINKGSTDLNFSKQGTSTLVDNPKPLLTKLDSIIENLNSYNSFQEFYNFTTRQGKQIEVEINLLKAYQGNLEAIKEFADIKLQSENGNPKFTAVVRNIDVYHRSKDRTWYTVTLEVTDFGLASKTPINLNVKLDEQIAKAKAEEKVANTEKGKGENVLNPEGSLITDAQNRLKGLSIEDQKKYASILKWCQLLIQKAETSNFYIDASNSKPIIEQLSNSSSSKFSYTQLIPLTNGEVLFKILINGITPLDITQAAIQQPIVLQGFNGAGFGIANAAIANQISKGYINLLNEMNNRASLDFGAEYISYFLFGTTAIIKEYSSIDINNISNRGPYVDDSRLHGTKNELNSKLSLKQNKITAPEMVADFGKALGCVGTTAVAGAITGSASAGAGGLVGATTIITTCIAGLGDDLYNSYINNSKETEDFKYTREQLFSAKSVGDFIKNVAIQVAIDVTTRGIGGAFKGGLKGAGTAIKDGFKQGELVKTGSFVVNKTKTISNIKPQTLDQILGIKTSIFNETTGNALVNKLKGLTNPTILEGKTIIVGSNQVTVNKVVQTTAEPDGFFLKVTDQAGQTKIVKLNEINYVPNEVFTPAPTVINNTSVSSTSYIPNSIIKPTSVSETNQVLEGILNGPNGTVTPGMKITITQGKTYDVELLGVVDDSSGQPLVTFKEIGNTKIKTLNTQNISQITYPNTTGSVNITPTVTPLPNNQIRS